MVVESEGLEGWSASCEKRCWLGRECKSPRGGEVSDDGDEGLAMARVGFEEVRGGGGGRAEELGLKLKV